MVSYRHLATLPDTGVSVPDTGVSVPDTGVSDLCCLRSKASGSSSNGYIS